MILKDNQLLKLNKGLEKRGELLEKQKASLKSDSLSDVISEENFIEEMQQSIQFANVAYNENILYIEACNIVLRNVRDISFLEENRNEFMFQMRLHGMLEAGEEYVSGLESLTKELKENIDLMQQHYELCLDNETTNNIEIAKEYHKQTKQIIDGLEEKVKEVSIEDMAEEIGLISFGEKNEVCEEKGEE